MSIDQPEVIDLLSTEIKQDCCVVAISDHLEWDNRDHLIALQNKVNNYLAFIESGEIYEARPEARGQAIEISIYCQYTPETEDDLSFLRFARNAIQNAGFRFSVMIDNKEFQIPKTTA